MTKRDYNNIIPRWQIEQESLGSAVSIWNKYRTHFSGYGCPYRISLSSWLVTKNATKSLHISSKRYISKPLGQRALGIEVLNKFKKYAESIIKSQGIELLFANIQDWKSIDDPTWKQLVIRFTVKSDPDRAFLLWDNLSNELGNLIRAQYPDDYDTLNEFLSVSLQW